MFSVVIPYFNKAKYILRCLDSVCNQSFKNFEIIVVNDGSTDGGLDEIIQKFQHKVTFLHQKNLGVSAARNAGIKAAKFKYIAFLDADDCWHFQYFERIHFLIQNEENITIIGAHYDNNKKFLKHHLKQISYFKFDNYFKSALKNTYFTSSSTVIAKSFFENNESFNPNLKSGEDLDVWFRAVKSGGSAFYINQTMVFYSDEDQDQATKSKINLNDSLVGNIKNIYKNLLDNHENSDFNKFVSVYIYFNLYPYFYQKSSNLESKNILNQIQGRYFALHLVYVLPFWIGNKIVKSERLNHFLRLYLKFVIRYFYS